jgi:CTD small phosphatase-like protein 2
MSKIYEIIIFTASSKDYAEAAVKKIDPDSNYIDFVLVRDDCMVTRNGFYLKDLRILKDRNLKDIIIVDNLTHSFGF